MERHFSPDSDYNEGTLTIDTFNNSTDYGIYSCYDRDNLCSDRGIFNFTGNIMVLGEKTRN